MTDRTAGTKQLLAERSRWIGNGIRFFVFDWILDLDPKYLGPFIILIESFKSLHPDTICESSKLGRTYELKQIIIIMLYFSGIFVFERII